MIISFKTKIRNCRPRRELPKRMIGLISGQRRGYRKQGGTAGTKIRSRRGSKETQLRIRPMKVAQRAGWWRGNKRVPKFLVSTLFCVKCKEYSNETHTH